MAIPSQVLSASSSPRLVLSSWKEVAHHLGVDVRTAQRWQKKTDIPIYRQPTDCRSHPFAYADELDAWLARRARGEEPLSRSVAEDGTGAEAPAARPERQDWRWRAGGLLLAGVMIVGTWLMRPWLFHGQPVRVVVDRSSMTVLDERDRVCWQREIPGLAGLGALRVPEFALDDWLVTDIGGAGRSHVLVNVPPRGGAETTGRLLAFDREGRSLWEFRYGRPRTRAGRSFSPSYVGRLLRHVQGETRDYVLAVSWHTLWYPTQVALLDPATGRLVEEYWHPGALHFAMAHDVDADGVDEMLLAGVNNPGPGLGHAVLVALKVPFSEAAWQPVGDWSPFTGSREMTYVVFPRPDLCSVEGRIPFVTALSTEGPDRLVVRIQCGDTSFFHTLASDLSPIDSRFSDAYFAHHHRLERQGLLEHAPGDAEQQCLRDIAVLPAAVDGNGPDLAERWKACQGP